ncbi:MAG: OmpA family protein [Bdellovibrionia bacterium]
MRKIFAFLFACLSSYSNAGVLGDFQTFTPNTDGLYFVSVDSAMTLKKGVFVANGYLSFARNHTLAYDNLVDLNRVNHKDSLTEFDFTFGYSFTDTLQLFLGVTNLLEQTPDSGQDSQVFITEGTHSFRPGLKWQFSSSPRSRWALMTSVDILNVKDDPYTGVDPDPIPNIQLAWSGAIGDSHTHGFNLGYRMRQPKDQLVPGALFYPLKDQLTFSYGYSHFISKPTRFIFETIGCYPLDKGKNKTVEDVSCLEFLGALRYRYSNSLAFVGGATVEAPGLQTLSPDWRVFVGANYYLPTRSSTASSAKVPAPTETPSASPATKRFTTKDLQFVPDQVDVIADQKVQLNVEGGEPPYVFDVVEGGGRVDESGGEYRAPSEAGFVRVRVTDRNLDEAFIVVRVTELEAADQKLSLSNVEFEFNSTELTNPSLPKLDAAIRELKKMRIRLLVVEGHTDDIGSAIYNEDLSERRAQAIANIIQRELGFRDDMIKAIGHGENKPLVPNRDDASRSKNRRVEFLIFND